MTPEKQRRAIRVFVAVTALVALANGLGNSILSNYFNEAFHIDSVQRGFIEVPRESPGILCMVLVAALGGLGNFCPSISLRVFLIWGTMLANFMST